MPDYSQNFNRYSYALNNPLIYSDPSGYWFLLDDAAVAGAGFVFGYVSYGITHGDWGGKALLNGGIMGLTAWIGYNTAGLAYGCVDKVTMNYIGSMAINTVANNIMPPMNIPLGKDFSLSVSPGFGMGASGLTGGLNFSGTYNNGDWALSAGYGISNGGFNISGGATFYDRANSEYFSYYANYFGGGKDNQTVGGLGFQKGDFSIRMENDYFADRHDRWRTAAAEMGYGDFVFGFNVYTNNPTPERNGVDTDGENLVGNKNLHGFGSWIGGLVYNAPGYVGFRNGNSVTRVGYSSRWVQDRTQNWIHRNFGIGKTSFGYQNYYNDYTKMHEGGYSYSGFYNPFTLY